MAAFERVMAITTEGSLRISAAVNLATCTVHQGQLSKAIEVMSHNYRMDDDSSPPSVASRYTHFHTFIYLHLAILLL